MSNRVTNAGFDENACGDNARETEEQFAAGSSRQEQAEKGQYLTGVEREFAVREALESQLNRQAERWREEVANRVEGYRTRRSRSRLAGEFSMKFDFDAPAPSSPRSSQSAPDEAEGHDHAWDAAVSSPGGAHAALALDPAYCSPVVPASLVENGGVQDQIIAEGLVSLKPAESVGLAGAVIPAGAIENPARISLPSPGTSAPVAKPAPLTQETLRESPPRRKIIEFPRSLIFPDSNDSSSFDWNELAEPVSLTPRILDVPETVAVPAPPLADLALDTDKDAEEVTDFATEFDLPLEVAPLPLRITAALVDWLLVVVATAVFAIIVLRNVTGVTFSKPVLGLAAMLPMVFWACYQYLFLVHGAATPGMQLAHLRLSTFDSLAPSRMRRRCRAVVMVLSCASLGFGFLWALIDEYNLCWHDKMTRTYLKYER